MSGKCLGEVWVIYSYVMYIKTINLQGYIYIYSICLFSGHEKNETTLLYLSLLGGFKYCCSPRFPGGNDPI